MEDLFFMGFFFAFMGFIIIFVAICFALFIIQAIGLFKIAKREGKGNIAWLAWIPAANQFLLTYLAEKDAHPDLKERITILYGVSLVVSILLAYFLPFTLLFPMGILLYAFYFIAGRYSERPLFHVVIAIISVGGSLPIQLFIFRNREKVKPDRTVVEETI